MDNDDISAIEPILVGGGAIRDGKLSSKNFPDRQNRLQQRHIHEGTGCDSGTVKCATCNVQVPDAYANSIVVCALSAKHLKEVLATCAMDQT